jgi:hypothetical protein
MVQFPFWVRIISKRVDSGLRNLTHREGTIGILDQDLVRWDRLPILVKSGREIKLTTKRSTIRVDELTISISGTSISSLESAVVVLEDESFFRDRLARLIEHRRRCRRCRRCSVFVWDDLSVLVDELPILVHEVT